MKVEGIACYEHSLTLTTGKYRMSQGRILVDQIPTTIVEVVSEDGIVGYGEACAMDGAYIDGFDRSVQETVRKLAPVVLGSEILDVDVIVARMDAELRRHLAGKAAIDAALWDLRGKYLRQPVATLLGGIHQPAYRVFYPISHGEPDAMAAEGASVADRGYHGWQVKVGGDPLLDADRVRRVVASACAMNDFITCDANCGWSVGQASLFVGLIAGVPAYVEQPCRTIAELADLRGRSSLPIMVDEAVCDMADLLLAFKLSAADAINIKPSRVGGLTKAARLRDTAQAQGWMVVIDEAMGGHLATAGVAHLAASCRPETFLGASCITSTHISDPCASQGIVSDNGVAHVPVRPGLGVDVDPEAFGEPLFSAGRSRAFP
jgi:L-alanine-DL-glutamate epimerase-like enolase superfamily enzyme